MKKRLVSFLLAISMVLTFLPVSAITAFAANDTDYENRTINCGATVTGKLTKNNDGDNTYTLTLSGTGTTGYFSPTPDWLGVVTQLVITDGITGIGSFSFSSISNLKYVKIAPTVTSIASNSFKDCKNLTTVEIYLPGSQLKTIGSYTFQNCTSLKEIKFPASMTNLGAYAFEGCTSLENATFIENSNVSLTFDSSVFKGCTSLKKITLPRQLSYIYTSDFEGCISLESVSANGSIGSIADNAFKGCSSLSSLGSWMASVTQIYPGAFEDCTSLKNIGFSSALQYIGANAFKNSGLTSVSIPKYNSSSSSSSHSAFIDTDAFANCSGLTSFSYPDTEENWKKLVTDGKVKDNLSDTTKYPNITSQFAHTVTFKNGNNTISSTVVSYNGLVNVPAAPSGRAGYTFDTWAYKDKSGTHTAEPLSQIRNVTENLEVSAQWLKNVTMPDNVTVKSGEDDVTVENNEIKVAAGTEITLTVTDPKYRESYEWYVNDTDDKAGDGETFTIEVTDNLNKITLKTIPHSDYDTEDFTVTGLGEYTYGDTVDVVVNPKNSSISGYTVQYVKDAGTQGEVVSDFLPKDAGTYTVRIKQDGKSAFDTSDSFTIKPATITVNDFAVTVPKNAVADGTEYSATVDFSNDCKFSSELKNYSEVSYQKKNGENWELATAPVKDAGTYRVVITVNSNADESKNTANFNKAELTDSAWEFTVAAKPTPKPDDTKKDDDKPGTEEPEKPVTKLYDLTVKNAEVTIADADGKAVETTKNEDGTLTAKVPEKAAVTVKYTAPTDAIVFDLWSITSDAKLDVNVKENPLTFTMPDKAVTIEAMTRDATIESEGPGVLGTAAMIGVGVAGTAVLGYQGYMIGTELYLKNVMPAGAAIPTNTAELAKLVWNDAGRPEPVALLAADATDEQKALTWAVENQLIPADKAADASVTRWEVIQTWNKEQEMKKA